jgi:hypothetical protein
MGFNSFGGDVIPSDGEGLRTGTGLETNGERVGIFESPFPFSFPFNATGEPALGEGKFVDCLLMVGDRVVGLPVEIEALGHSVGVIVKNSVGGGLGL